MLHQNHKEYKNILGSLQLIAKYVNYIDKHLVARTDILKICGQLLDHPVDEIAIESLKLRRAIKKFLHVPIKENSTPTYLVNATRREAPQHTKKQAVSSCKSTVQILPRLLKTWT